MRNLPLDISTIFGSHRATTTSLRARHRMPSSVLVGHSSLRRFRSEAQIRTQTISSNIISGTKIFTELRLRLRRHTSDEATPTLLLLRRLPRDCSSPSGPAAITMTTTTTSATQQSDLVATMCECRRQAVVVIIWRGLPSIPTVILRLVPGLSIETASRPFPFF